MVSLREAASRFSNYIVIGTSLTAIVSLNLRNSESITTESNVAYATLLKSNYNKLYPIGL